MVPRPDFTSESNRWQAVLQRDPDAVGAFFYGVVTTGIYCRPGCASRRPNRSNVQFFDSPQLAEAAGFRPCKRCEPNDTKAPNTSVEVVAEACKIMDTAEKVLTLKELADVVGLSPYYFHRLFKKTTGITPKQYAMEVRLNRVRANLQGDSTVTEAIYESGYESGSRFYEKAKKSLGMKPSAYQKGGEGIMIRYGIVQSYLGWVLVAVTKNGVCRIDFDDRPEILKTRLESNFPKAELQEDEPSIRIILSETLAFLETPEGGFALPLDVQGTAFQRRVWAALQEVQPGETASYGEIAQRIGNSKAARAVAQACASNKIAVAIPCHRVVRGDGSLGGYRWGLDRKRALLKRESKNAV